MSDRMTILTLSYWLKLNLNFSSSDPVETLHPLHPMTDEMELFSAQPELFGRTTWAKQLGLLIRKYWIQPSESVKQDKPPAPWDKTANSNSVAFELTELPRAKSECTFEELETARKLVEEKVEEFKKDPSAMIIFTDASVSEDGETSYGVHINSASSEKDEVRSDCNLRGRIPLRTSTATAELHAIRMGLREAHKILDERPHVEQIITYTDSRSAFDILRQSAPSDNVLIHKAIKSLLNEKQQIFHSFQWLPSHIGIQGNEKADTLAEEGRYVHYLKAHLHAYEFDTN